MKEERIKNSLLEAAKDSPLRQLLQFDGRNVVDENGRPPEMDAEAHYLDKQGDRIYATAVYDLGPENAPVRVQIAKGTDKKTALRLLRKILDSAERSYHDIYPHFGREGIQMFLDEHDDLIRRMAYLALSSNVWEVLAGQQAELAPKEYFDDEFTPEIIAEALIFFQRFNSIVGSVEAYERRVKEERERKEYYANLEDDFAV